MAEDSEREALMPERVEHGHICGIEGTAVLFAHEPYPERGPPHEDEEEHDDTQDPTLQLGSRFRRLRRFSRVTHLTHPIGLSQSLSSAGMRLIAENLSRSFSGRRIFGPLSFEVAGGQALGISGRNGAGKTTLLKTIAGLIRPSLGSVVFERDGGLRLDAVSVRPFLGWAAPDLALYGELSGLENLQFFHEVSGFPFDEKTARSQFESLGLPRRAASVPTRTLSTGQRQRLKLAFATSRMPSFLLLDEPSANLDAEGFRAVAMIVEAQRARGGVAIIASNDPRDLGLASATLDLGEGH